MAWLISERQMYSSAEWLRLLCPGPSFSEGKGMSAWSLSVGEPKGVIPMSMHRLTSGWSWLMDEEWSRKERGFSSHLRMCLRRNSKRYSFW